MIAKNFQFRIFEPYQKEMFHGVFRKPFNVHYKFGSDEEVNKNRDAIVKIAANGHTHPLRVASPERENAFYLVSAEQTHSKHVALVTERRIIRSIQDEIPLADALITNRPGILLMVKTADCQPIFLYDPVRKACGMVHCGWRGTIQNIVGETISRMVQAFSSRAEDIFVAIGPSLGPCHSEFQERDKDFHDFEAYFLENSRVDLLAITKNQLREAGIHPKHVEFSDICTVCQRDTYFSFRGDKPDQGRFASVIGVL